MEGPTTKIITCTCENKGQDEMYGKHRRVGNQTKKGDGSLYRCTVCGKELTK
jgi:predicted SprT family Zn-dependent metalloprotease